MTFRPLVWPTAVTLPGLIVLIALGLWQLERREWKHALMAEIEAGLASAPVSVDALAAESARGLPVNYRPVEATGRFAHERELHLFRPSVAGEPGYHILTPLLREGAPAVIVDRGFVPPEFLDPATRQPGQAEGLVTVRGIARADDVRHAFTPANVPAENLWYVRDSAAMAAAMGITPALPFIVEADAAPNPGGLPRGGQTAVSLRDAHLGYAITWFGLAAALAVVYLAYHGARGRLRWRSGRGICGPKGPIPS